MIHPRRDGKIGSSERSVMEPTSELPSWFLPVLLIGFPVVFVGFWSLICALIATLTGYRSLAPLRIEAAQVEEGEKLPTPGFALLGPGRYRGGILSLRASNKGLTLRIARIFPFHPPIRVPWERVQEEAEGGGFWGKVALKAFLLDGRVRLRVPEATFAAIREAKARYAR